MPLMRLLKRLAGLERWRPLEAKPDAKAALHLQYLTFKDLITSNDEILEVIADVEKRLEGETTFGMAFVRSRCVTAASHAYRMIHGLNTLSHRRYQELYARFSEIQKSVERTLTPVQVREKGPLVLPLGAVHLGLVDRVGGKSANLGELKNRARLPVPEGFAISTEACLQLFEANQLWDEIRALLQSLDVEDAQSVEGASESIRSTILTAPLPAPLEASILQGYAALCEKLGGQPRVSLRSSAVGEDGELSFAGQYVTILNVPADTILDAFKDVIAGLYTPRAICYRALRGILDEDVPMGVTCQAMVEATASGVACSVDPSRPAARRMVITAAWGLGAGTVEGSVSPDSWRVSKDGPPVILRRSAGAKETKVSPLPPGGVGPVPVPPEARPLFSLSDGQVVELAGLVLAVENHYGSPQEIEWALDGSGRFQLLQSRPLKLSAPGTEQEEVPPEVDGHPLLLKGAPASAGCGSGPAFLSFGPQDMAGFPEGAVLVARHSQPQYVRLMDRAAAIVTDVGAPNGHMASLAREFNVPAALDTREATALLKPGDIVTVDGNRGAVYGGRVESLLAAPRRNSVKRMAGTPVHRVLTEVSRHLVALNLTDPRSPDFSPRNCRSFHDIARFVHEKAFEEMFRISDRVSGRECRCVPLEARLPFTVYFIDLGGGLILNPEARSVTLEEVDSLPMQALLDGMTNPELRWWAPRALSLRGFASVTTEAIFTPFVEHGERQLGDRGYAIVADAYCNFSSRIGYHFTAVDAYCGDSPSRNYVSFRFKGGAADITRRVNRSALIERILQRLDFQVERRGDLVNARMRKYGRQATLEALDQIGRLIVATRQLDMRLGPGTDIEWYVRAFLEGNYLFDPQARAAPGRGDA